MKPFLAGAAYVYTNINGTWLYSQTISNREKSLIDRFGLSISIDGDRIVIGDPGMKMDNGQAPGAVFIYGNDNGVWDLHQKISPSEPVMNFGFGGATAISGKLILVGTSDFVQVEGVYVIPCIQ